MSKNHNYTYDPKNDIHVVSFSGGRTSAYLVYLMEIKRVTEGWNIFYVFMDTGAEHPETYEFIRKMVEEWGIKITILRVVVNPIFGIGVTYKIISLSEMKFDMEPWIDMLTKYGSPTINAPRCTSRLKSEPHDKYCDETFGRGNYITWLGIRTDEPKRLKHFQSTVDMFDDKKVTRPIRYLAELSNINKAGVLEWWKQQSFDLNLPEWLGNCVFCIKKSQPKLWAAAKDEPELANMFREAIMAKTVRKLPSQKFEQGVIYRGHNSIDGVIKMSKVLPEKELYETLDEIEVFAEDDPTLCSESCEVFGPEDYVDDFELVAENDGHIAA